MTINIAELEAQAKEHLTALIRSKILDHKKTYDYLKWNSEWNTSPATSDSILRLICGLEDNQEEELDHFRQRFRSFISYYLRSISTDQALLLKFFRFYMSLPIFEYWYESEKYERMEDIPPFQGSERSNSFMLSMCNFSFKDHKEIHDRELKKTMNEIFEFGIIDYGVLEDLVPIEIKYKNIDGSREVEYINDSWDLVFGRVRAFLKYALKKSCDVKSESLKPKIKRQKLSGITEVDLALFVPKSGTKMYSCVEYKQFPINPKYYGPHGEFNPMDLFKDYIEEEKESISRKDLALHKFLRQIMCAMLSHKCNRGILTDSYTFIFLEIDLKRSKVYLNEYSGEKASIQISRDIPINYTVKNCHTSKVTLRQALLDFFNKSIVDGDRLKEIEEEMTNLLEYCRLSDEEYANRMNAKRTKSATPSKLNQSYGLDAEGTMKHRYLDDSSEETSSIFSDIPSSKHDTTTSGIFDNLKPANIIKAKQIIVPQNKFDVLKHGYDRYSQVYSIETSYLSEFLDPEVRSTDRVVIKIHDPWYYPNDDFLLYDDVFKKETTESNLRKRKILACEENYKFERRCYKILEKDPKFNSIAYDHDQLKLSFCCLRGFFRKGMTNIFRYIDTVELPKDEATYQKAVEQLEIIHKNGIIHNDVSERNILYSKDGKVYIIDYSFSFFSTKNERVEKDNSDLKRVFFK